MRNNNPDLLSRRVDKILPNREGLEKLLTQKKIRLYQGFDPSKPNLHIGHLVGLLQLKSFQDAGHEVIFLIGDFTGMIGDPTDKSATRPKLSREEVLENAKTYREQASKILRFDGENSAKIMFNSEWLSKMTFADIIEMASNFTAQQFLERDMFEKRLKEEKPIFLHELLYPLMVTQDAVAMKVDLEIGGRDQLFNMTVGRSYVRMVNGIDKYALTTKLLVDSSGNKIGKTAGNAVNLFGKPEDLYGGIMSVPDSAIENMLVCATEIPMEKVQELVSQIKTNPMSVKKQLAWEITRMCNDEKTADKAQSHFQDVVQSKMAPTEAPTILVRSTSPSPSPSASPSPSPEPPLTIVEILKSANLGVSNSDIKRTIEQGGVELNGTKITDPNQELEIKGGETLKFGKRTYRKIIVN